MSAGCSGVQARRRLLYARLECNKQLPAGDDLTTSGCAQRDLRLAWAGTLRGMLIDRKMIFDGRVIKVSVDTVDLPNGVRLPLEIVRHPGGAAAVAIDAENRVCMLRQYRHAAGGYIYELPAGKLEPNEPPEITVKRELAEEASMSATQWESLGAYFSSPGVFTEVIHLYLATGLTRAAASPEADEVFQVEWWPLPLALERARNGELTDGKTIIGIFRAAARQKIA